jgi:hypothetical protein
VPLSRNGMILLALFVTSFAVRVRFAGTYAESWDAVDFALALERFDIFQMQPHFPGYPLYILSAHLFLPWAGDPVQALTWLSACFGSLSLFPFYALANRLLSEPAAVWVSVLLFWSNPLVGLTHVQPMSEALGLFVVLLLLASVARSLHREGERLWLSAVIGVILFALLLGIRLSYFPVGCVLLHPLIRLFRQRRSLSGFVIQAIALGVLFVAAVAVWLLPAAATEGGLVPYLQLGQAFTVGHFTDWGGTSFSTDLSWGQRMYILLAERLLANGLLGASDMLTAPPLPSPFTCLLLLAFVCLAAAGAAQAWQRSDCTNRLFVLLAVVPYAVWVFFGQNSEKARHILPILPWLFLLAGCGWAAVWRRLTRRTGKAMFTASSLLILAALFIRLWTVYQQHLQPPPTLQLVHLVQARYSAENTYLYTWEEERLFDYYAPDFGTERVRSFPYFLQSLQLRADTVSHVLVTNAVLDGFTTRLHPYALEVARFTADPFLYPTYHTVILYELPRPVINRLKSGWLPPETG